MNLAFAMDYIPRRMREMGYGENYLTRYRHLRVGSESGGYVGAGGGVGGAAVITVGSTITVKAHNQIWLFIEPITNIVVESDKGVFNLADNTINEQQHEHSGVIKITNNTTSVVYALFLQVIPLNRKKKK
jgi:hypothetical protein